jgi:hypothetical protein
MEKLEVRKTNANSHMVWQIIHAPTGRAVSGPRGTYPGQGLLSGSATMGQMGWKTKTQATAALAALQAVREEA